MMTPEQQNSLIQPEMRSLVAALQQAFHPQGITVKAQVKDGCLRLLLEGLPVPEPEVTLETVRQTMQRLQLEPVPLQIYGRILGADRPSWQRSLLKDIAPAEAPLERPQTQPTPRLEPVVVRSPETKPTPHPVTITPAGWSALITGFVLAIGLAAIGFLNLLFHGFIVLVHEIGHAVTHWVFGEPAIPAVNILYGGGITLAFERSPLVLAIIYGGILFGIWRCRTYPRVQGLIVLFSILYTICLVTPLSRIFTVLMGHGMELTAIFVCIFLAATGYFCRFAGDRSIYAMLGFYTLFSNLRFSWNLLRNPEFREWYEGGIGGMIDNDLVILATQYFHVDLSVIAQLLLFGCIGVIALTFLAIRYEQWGWAGLNQVISYRSVKQKTFNSNDR